MLTRRTRFGGVRSPTVSDINPTRRPCGDGPPRGLRSPGGHQHVSIFSNHGFNSRLESRGADMHWAHLNEEATESTTTRLPCTIIANEPPENDISVRENCLRPFCGSPHLARVLEERGTSSTAGL
jgi:hypothetical protein